MNESLTPLLQKNPVAVVGAGCLLPGASSVDEFQDVVRAGRTRIRPLPPDRWDLVAHSAEPARSSPDTSDSTWAGWIEPERMNAARQALPGNDWSRLEVMTHHALTEALGEGLALQSAPERRAILLGCMSQVDDLNRRLFWFNEAARLFAAAGDNSSARSRFSACRESWEQAENLDPQRLKSDLMPASLLAGLARRINAEGASALIDAACASSLAAIEAACLALLNDEADVVFTGGIEANLSIESFVAFSRLNALAPEACQPFAEPATGLSQGEGAVIFLLQRLQQARQLGLPVLGVIKGLGAASDGRGSGIFEPSDRGQVTAYRRAYSGIQPNQVGFLECHATGTARGDETERRSIQAFFDQPPQLGAAKGLFGHTKAAAGSIGLLRCLGRMNGGGTELTASERAVSGHFEAGTDDRPASSERELQAVSAFGFGGINYHVVVGPAPDVPERACPSIGKKGVVICSHVDTEVPHPSADRSALGLRLPRRSLERMDPVQIAALVACGRLFRRCLPGWDLVDRETVRVVVGSITGTPSSRDLGARLGYRQLAQRFAEEPERTLVRACATHYAVPDEETAPAILSNVIAGRIANHFDLKGPAANVDRELTSPGAALKHAVRSLELLGGVAVAVTVEETWDEETLSLQRGGVRAWLLADEETVRDLGLPAAGWMSTRP